MLVDNVLAGALRNIADTDDTRMRLTWCDIESHCWGARTPLEVRRAVSTSLSDARTRGERGGDGNHTPSCVHVDDDTDALEGKFRLHGMTLPGQPNTGEDREVPVLETAKFVGINVPGPDVPGPRVTFSPRIAQHPASRCPDLARSSAKVTGWAPCPRFKQAISRIIEGVRDAIARSAFPLAPAALRV